jgi:hypothetical protein
MATMTPERWARIKQLFQEALAVEVERRVAFLNAACVDDIELRRQVELMLCADAETGHLIDQPLPAAAAELFIEENSELPNEGRLGHYRLTREIGRGGMGAVYAAIRDDDQYRQKVAIKLVKADLAGSGVGAESILQRFRRERQIGAAGTSEHRATARRWHDAGRLALFGDGIH